MSYECFLLDEATRRELLEQFPPLYEDVVAHHITHRFGVPRDPEAVYGAVSSWWVVGQAVDDSLQALVVAQVQDLNGQLVFYRPDQKRYHITWSLSRAAGRTPVQSNAVIATGFLPVPVVPFKATFAHLAR